MSLPIYCRFISFPYIESCPRPGPAISKYYTMSPDLVLRHPEFDVEPSFRSELSKAFCGLYFLRPHSVVISEYERVPIDQYFDPDAYDHANCLYFNPDNPYKDLKRCRDAIEAKRIVGEKYDFDIFSF